MNLDLDSLRPEASSWFSTRIVYEGCGSAEFDDPMATVRGPVKIEYDEYGNCSGFMTVEEMDTPEPLEFGAMQLVFGGRSTRETNGVQMAIGLEQNTCTRFEAITRGGTLSSVGDVSYGADLGDIASESSWRLYLHPLRSQFDFTPSQAPKFWVLPLFNFLSEFGHRHVTLDEHPLRIFRTPAVPSGLSERDALRAALTANVKNRLIIFEFNNSLGFIEPLADFVERKNALLSEQDTGRITAVMVGDVGSNPVDFEQLDSWFPFEFLNLLSLATGTEIGAPWLEFRDAEGNLLRRIHVRMNCVRFSKGRGVINEATHRGTGVLLTTSTGSPHYKTPYINGVIKNFVRGGPYNSNIPNRLSHLFRSLDGLCQHSGMKRPQVPNKENREIIEKLVGDISKRIRDLARHAKDGHNSEEARLICRIAKQVASAKDAKVGFGDAVLSLMKEHGLHDAEVMAAYHKQMPGLERPDWPSMLSHYRGVVMHGDYFDVGAGKEKIEHLFRTAQHLHDILARILLKMLGYSGTYQPTVLVYEDTKDLNWVTSDTLASQLGYTPVK